jgi:hypothetical protein
MCGLCGILGDEKHWANLNPSLQNEEMASFRRNERQSQIKYLNRLLGAFSCTVTDWQGSAYLLSTFTGKTEIVHNLTQLWTAIEQLSGQRPDPLATHVLARLEQTS